MKCPNCGTVLSIAERHTVEIDYCPSCRGVWLDKGELDKIIDLANQQLPSFSKRDDPYDDKRDAGHKDSRRDDDRDDRYEDKRDFRHKDYRKDDDKDDRGYYENKNKKKSFLSDLFDFG